MFPPRELVYSEMPSEEGEEEAEGSFSLDQREEDRDRKISNGGRQDIDISELHFG